MTWGRTKELGLDPIRGMTPEQIAADSILGHVEVTSLTTLSRAMVYNLLAVDDFPPVVNRGGPFNRQRGWRRSSLIKWLSERAARRVGGVGLFSDENCELLRTNEVTEMTGLQRGQIAILLKHNADFPQPLELTQKRRAYVLAEIEQWMAKQTAQ